MVADWQRNPAALDLMITALRELASVDPAIAKRCRDALPSHKGSAAQLLGARLLEHLPPKE